MPRFLVGLAVAIGLAACAPLDAERNLLVPLAEGGTFGYQESAAGESAYEVRFTGPRRVTSPFSTNTQKADIAAAREEARDHALWRAAELALAQGHKTLAVKSAESDAEVYLSRRPSASDFFPRNIHHFSRDDPAYRLVRYRRSSPMAYVVATSLLKVRFDGDAAVDARQTIDRLRAKYPGPYNSRPGSHKVIAGNAASSSTRTPSEIRNGATPRNVSASGTSGARELMTNTFMPTGGVISPTSTTISASTPNQIATAPASKPKSKVVITGTNSGTVSRIMLRLSMTQPSTR